MRSITHKDLPDRYDTQAFFFAGISGSSKGISDRLDGPEMERE